jgi:MFS family permease
MQPSHATVTLSYLNSPPAAALAAALALAVAMGIGRFAFTPLLPMMQADAGVTLAAGGWLASANYLGYLAGALLAPLLRIRPGAVIRFALATVVAVTLAMGLTDHFALWMLLRAVAGIMSAWLLIFTSDWCLQKIAARPQLGGVLFGGVGAGIALAGAACLALMLVQADSDTAWLALGVMALAITALVWPAFRGTAMAARSASGGQRKFGADEWRLIRGNAANGFGYIVPATFLPAMAKEMLNDPAVFGWAWPIFGAAAMLSTLAAGAALRFAGNRRLWAGSHFVMAAGAVLPVFIPGFAAILFSALAVGGTFMVATMCAIREARTVAGADATRLVAAVVAAFALGQIAGPLCVAALANQTDPYAPALLLAGLLLVASGCELARRPISTSTGGAT